MSVESTGVVIIGRNEGERLVKSILSISIPPQQIVYVDSGSTDGSYTTAEKMGVHVVLLNCEKIPFSAGRARNAGFNKLLEIHPTIKYVQFIDGDCQLEKTWLDSATSFLENHSTAGIVCGRRKETFPHHSIYNRLCDFEWNGPHGEINSCGGDFMIRSQIFKETGGFNITVIAGEEPELCYRIKKTGKKIYRLDQGMTLHDAAIKQFSQWWKRTARSGHAYAQGLYLHRGEKPAFCLRNSASIWLWAVIFPTAVLLLTILLDYKMLALMSLYGILFIRTYRYSLSRTEGNHAHSSLYAFFTILGKWAQLQGQILFLKRLILKNKFQIIEY